MRGPFTNISPLKNMPGHPETSRLRSPRDPDSSLMVHKKLENSDYNITSLALRVSQLESQFKRLRTRSSQIGEGAGGLNLRGEWDATQTAGVYVTKYLLNDLVVISLGINQGSFVWIGTAPGNSPPYTGGQNWMELPGGALGQWF